MNAWIFLVMGWIGIIIAHFTGWKIFNWLALPPLIVGLIIAVMNLRRKY